MHIRANLILSVLITIMNFMHVVLVWIPLLASAHGGFLSHKQISGLESLIRDVVRCRNIPGMAVALVRADETVYVGGFGYKEFTKREPVTETTLFNLASNSKAFTSTIAADAVARGKLSWDAPIREVVGEHFRLDDDFRSEDASLRDFLSHRLGIPGYWGIITSALNLTRIETLERIKNFTPRFDFRDRYLYNNYMYTMAAAVVQTATCETWEDAIENRIFKPLGMTGSRVSRRLSDADWDNMAYSHEVLADGSFVKYDERGRLPIVQEIAAAAGVYSNAEDMAKWMRFHLNNGKDQNGKEVVDETALKATYAPNTAEYSPSLTKPDFPVDDMTFSYAMGWRYGVYNGYRKTFHMASYSAYQGTLTLLPDGKVGVWTYLSGAANGKGYNARRTVSMYALDMLLGKEPWINASTACSFPAPWKVPRVAAPKTTTPPPTLPPGYVQPSIALNVSLYLGEYHHPAFGTLEILEGDEHIFTYKYGELMRGYLTPRTAADFNQVFTGPLSILHYGYNNKYPDGLPVTFHWEDGDVTGVQFHYFDFSLPPLFTKDNPEIGDKSEITKNWCPVPPTTTTPVTSSTVTLCASAILITIATMSCIINKTSF